MFVVGGLVSLLRCPLHIESVVVVVIDFLLHYRRVVIRSTQIF